jgi:mercuric ion binding protein
MKNLKIAFASLFAVISLAFISHAKPMHDETTTFKVYGNCEMCKKRIETALKANKSILSANWNVETKMATVTFDPHMINADDVQKIVADAGHDTDKVKAKDAVYNKLTGCCQYDRKK